MPTNPIEIKRKGKEFADDLVEKASEAKDAISETVIRIRDNAQNSFDTAKDKYSNLEATVSKYCKKSPMKAVGLSLLAGFIFAQLFRK